MKHNILRKKIRQKINRSGTKECDICKQHGILVEHHIEGRDIPFPNKLSNLTSICPNCHTKIHFGDIIIEGWTTTTNGKELMWHPRYTKGIIGRDAQVHLFEHPEQHSTHLSETEA